MLWQNYVENKEDNVEVLERDLKTLKNQYKKLNIKCDKLNPNREYGENILH
jgi:Tfp pilus assembly protein PilO